MRFWVSNEIQLMEMEFCPIIIIIIITNPHGVLLRISLLKLFSTFTTLYYFFYIYFSLNPNAEYLVIKWSHKMATGFHPDNHQRFSQTFNSSFNKFLHSKLSFHIPKKYHFSISNWISFLKNLLSIYYCHFVRHSKPGCIVTLSILLQIKGRTFPLRPIIKSRLSHFYFLFYTSGYITLDIYLK